MRVIKTTAPCPLLQTQAESVPSDLIPRIDLGVDPNQVLENPGVHAKEIRSGTSYSETDNNRLMPFQTRSPYHQRSAAVALAGILTAFLPEQTILDVMPLG